MTSLFVLFSSFIAFLQYSEASSFPFVFNAYYQPGTSPSTNNTEQYDPFFVLIRPSLPCAHTNVDRTCISSGCRVESTTYECSDQGQISQHKFSFNTTSGNIDETDFGDVCPYQYAEEEPTVIPASIEKSSSQSFDKYFGTDEIYDCRSSIRDVNIQFLVLSFSETDDCSGKFNQAYEYKIQGTTTFTDSQNVEHTVFSRYQCNEEKTALDLYHFSEASFQTSYVIPEDSRNIQFTVSEGYYDTMLPSSPVETCENRTQSEYAKRRSVYILCDPSTSTSQILETAFNETSEPRESTPAPTTSQPTSAPITAEPTSEPTVTFSPTNAPTTSSAVTILGTSTVTYCIVVLISTLL